jgi:hypothetical protein
MPGITHTKVSAKSDGGDSSLVLPSDWNADHTVSNIGGTPAVVLSTTAAAGNATTYLRTNDQLILFDATAPTTQAFSDAAATGSAAIAARRDHKHAWPALGTSAAAVGTSAGGSAVTPSKSDHVHATGAGTPSTQAFADAAATGTGPAAAMTDHKHAMPAAPTAASVGAVSVINGGLETVSAVGATGTTETLSLTAGNIITLTVDNNCTFTMPSGLTSGVGISFTVILTDSGGPRTITFTGVLWSGGTDPTTMSAASAIDIYSFLTINGGTTWYGFKGGTGFAT